MMVLWEKGDMTESELGHIVRLDSGTLTPLLKRLEKQGLIVRSRPESNERKLFLSLTDKGMALRERALDVPGQMHGCIDLEAEELTQLKTLLDKALSVEEIPASCVRTACKIGYLRLFRYCKRAYQK